MSSRYEKTLTIQQNERKQVIGLRHRDGLRSANKTPTDKRSIRWRGDQRSFSVNSNNTHAGLVRNYQ